MDETDYQFRHVVAGGRLRREDETPRHRIELRIVHETIVEDDDVEREQKLALVLVEPLHLHVEYRLRVEIHPEIALHPVGEMHLVGVFDVRKTRKKRLVARELLEFLEFVEVRNPAVADGFGDEFRKCGVGFEEPAAGRDAVGHVQELLRPELVEVLEERLLENLRM